MLTSLFYSTPRNESGSRERTAISFAFSSRPAVFTHRLRVGGVPLLVLSCLASGLAVDAPAGESGSGSSRDALPETLFLRPEALAAQKQRLEAGDSHVEAAFDELIRRAEEALEQEPVTIVSKPQTPPSGDKHDYMSLGPYWWPDPDSEDGLPYIQRDGEVNPERYDYDLPRLDAVTRAVRDLGPAYYFSENEEYAEHAALLLRTFFIDVETRMNPNLKYAQIRRGHGELNPGGIIETTRFRDLIDSILLLKGSEAWTNEDHTALKRWFGDYTDWLVNSEHAREEAEAANNHGTWWAYQAVLYALFSGKNDVALEVLKTIPDRISDQIEPDGRQPYEIVRTRSFHYHDFNNRGLLRLARLASHVDFDLASFETDDGRGIRTAVEFLIPYATGGKEWEWEQISDIRYNNVARQFRRASVVFEDPKFERAIERLPDGGKGHLHSSVRLLDPPPELEIESGYR